MPKVVFIFIRRLIDGIGIVGAVSAGLCLLVMAFSVCVGTISRYAFNKPFNWIDEFAGGLLIPLFFLPLLYALILGRHIKVNIVVDRLPRKLVSYALIINSLLALIYGGFLFSEGLRLTQQLIQYETRYVTFDLLPQFAGAIFIPIGSGIFCLGLLALLVSQVRTLILKSAEAKLPARSDI